MRITKIKTKNFIILFFALILTLAVFSQLKAFSSKPTSDVGFDGQGWFYSKSDKGISAFLGKKDSNVPTARYQKDNHFLEFSMNQVSSTTDVSLETNTKEPNTPTLFYRNVAEDIDANYKITNLPFRVKEEIILGSLSSLSSYKVESGENNLTFLFDANTNAIPVKQPDGSIYFYDSQNNYLFQIDKPFMVDNKGIVSNEVSVEIKPTKTKTTPEGMVFGGSNLERNRGLPPDTDKFNGIKNIVKLLWGVDVNNAKVLDLGGIEPPESLVATRDPRQARPRTKLFYHKETLNPKPTSDVGLYTLTLSANSGWLNDPARVYPVTIDPTITHDESAEFNGQYNRIANASTTAVQLESSYPEATKDPYTVLLLHFNEANGATSGIKDYASTTRVITANDNASTTSYVTQLGLGNSAAFDGTSDYFEIADSEDWDFTSTSTDMTISLWIYPNDILNTRLIGQSNAGADGNWSLGISQSDNDGDIYLGTAGGPVLSSGNSAIVAGKWYHIAIAKRNGFTEMYKNGLLVSSGSAAYFNNATTFLRIGARAAADGDFNGYLDEIRIIKGRALTIDEIKAAASRRPYAVYTSPVLDATASASWNTLNWTEGGVKTGDGETLYNSNSLVAQWNFNETSDTTAANNAGSCGASCNGTLTNFSYTASQDQATTTTGWTANNKKWGAGALMFESANAPDYVSISDPASNALDPGTGDFSVEGWIKSSTAGQDTILQNNTTVGACAANAGYILIVNGNKNLAAYASDGTTCFVNNLTANASSTEIADGRWHHFAFAADRDTKAYVYYDGRLATSTSISNTTAANPAATIYTGASGATGDSDFLLDSLRYYSRALSAAEILSNYQAGNIEIQTRAGATSDPNDGTWEAWKPTTGETQLLSMDSDQSNWNAPEQIDGYTKLLLHMDGADAATTFPNSATTTHTVTANGNAQVDTAQSKFSGASGLFDGTGDYLSLADSDDWDFGSGYFTVETWVNFSAISGRNGIIGQYVDATHYWYLRANFTDSEGLGFEDYNGAATVSFAQMSNSGWSPGVWYHIALVKNGSSFNIYRNGISIASVTDSDSLTDYAANVNIGLHGTTNYLTGSLDELRISKGIARWTSNFTPPPRPYGSNVKAENETTIKQEGSGSTKLTLGAPQIDGNTVALWHFEETGTSTGTYLYDETANNNDATTTGTTVVDGIFGKARKFNGTSDYLSVADSANWNFGGGDFSVDFWVNFSSLAGRQALALQHDDTSNKWVIDLWGTGYGSKEIEIYSVAAGSTRVYAYTSPTNIIAGVWYHIAIIREGITPKIYLNGVSQSMTITDSFATMPDLTAPLDFGKWVTGDPLKGSLDEFRILKGRALSPDEIAETYRMGANHHLTRQISAADLSSATKLPFYIAADRPGTYLEAMVGESDYANYELASSTLALSTTTVLYIKGDEIAPSTSIKDSSFSGKTITANGNARTAGGGKIGNAMSFDGTSDYFELADNDDWDFTAGNAKGSIDFWFYANDLLNSRLVGQNNSGADGNWSIYINSSDNDGDLGLSIAGGAVLGSATGIIKIGKWYHVAAVKDGSTTTIYLNSAPLASGTGTYWNNATTFLRIGGRAVAEGDFNGLLDELRIIKGTALTADQIRQAYEYGLRSHPITIDFGATLQTSDLISSATDYNFSLTATTSGLSATTSGLYLGDKIIIKENLGGTEYTAQGTVNAINTSTGAITVPSWDSGSTFPSGNGYSPNATVFKWQREYFDLTGSLSTHRDAVTNLTLRPTNGASGRTIYLDDFRYNTNYLTASSSSAITSSNNRYLQYRTIFTSTDTYVSPFLSVISTLYTSLANSFPSIIGISGGGFLSF